ncbi:hypothetical protein C8R44DRAFT_330066 [Mycena epipterygia]|nr:hypothetical protein C8R44DRAFT_330066 [Mycena epipterygia]
MRTGCAWRKNSTRVCPHGARAGEDALAGLDSEEDASYGLRALRPSLSTRTLQCPRIVRPGRDLCRRGILSWNVTQGFASELGTEDLSRERRIERVTGGRCTLRRGGGDFVPGAMRNWRAEDEDKDEERRGGGRRCARVCALCGGRLGRRWGGRQVSSLADSSLRLELGLVRISKILPAWRREIRRYTEEDVKPKREETAHHRVRCSMAWSLARSSCLLLSRDLPSVKRRAHLDAWRLCQRVHLDLPCVLCPPNDGGDAGGRGFVPEPMDEIRCGEEGGYVWALVWATAG